MKNYRDFLVWQKAHKLALLVYKVTHKFPKGEQYKLTLQLRKAAVSSPTNVAEGCGKFTQKDFAKFLQDALGSTQEIEYLSFLSFELDYMDMNTYKELDSLTNEVKAMLIGLLKKVRADL